MIDLTTETLGVPHSSLRPQQAQAILKSIEHHRNGGGNIFIEAPTGCHAKGQGILMFDGEVVNAEDIKIGDIVMGWDSTPRTVLSTIRNSGNMVTIIPIKGTPFTVNEDHVLTLERTKISSGNRTRNDCKDGNVIDISIKEYQKWSKTQKHIHKLFRRPVVFSEKELLIKPHFLGVLLGDGCIINGVSASTPDQELMQEIEHESIKHNCHVTKHHKVDENCFNLRLSRNNKSDVNPVAKLLIGLNLYGCRSEDKFIPFIYKTASVEQRKQLLAGLIDTDGSISNGCVDYVSKSEVLANDVVFVARSLGLAAYVHPCQKYCQTGGGGTYYRVTVSGRLSDIPMIVERKKVQDRKQIKNVLRTGFSIRSSGYSEYFGFTISGDGRYLLDDFTVTHNCGKSTIACAMASEDNTTVLVSTLGLLEQYERIYGFKIIKGRQEYLCVHKSKVKEWKSKYGIAPKASDCHYKRSYDCEYSGECPYLVAKDIAINAKKTACTYKYASMSDGIKKRTGIIAFDECHNSAEEMLSFMEFTINNETMDKYNLPHFPLDHYGSGGEGDVVNSNVSIIINAWMILCVKTLNDFDIFETLTPRGVAKMRLSEQFVKVMSRMEREKEWFLYWGTEKESNQHSLFNFKASGKKMIFSLKPLSAKTASDDILQNKKTRIFMSATIGKPDGLAFELGLDNFFSYEYDHPVPAEYRPVYDLGMDKMTRDNLSCNPQLYRVQAVKIKNFINSLDHTWRGIILTTSYYKIKQLKEILYPMIGDRIFQYSQEAKTVTGRINEFINDKRNGMIAIDTIAGWGTGLDLRDDIARFAIIAGVPFPNPSDRYEQARMQRDGGRKYALWKTYNSIPQISGRVSRGEKDSNGNWLTNVSAIADGNALMPQARMYYPNWYKESIVKGE